MRESVALSTPSEKHSMRHATTRVIFTTPWCLLRRGVNDRDSLYHMAPVYFQPLTRKKAQWHSGNSQQESRAPVERSPR